MQDAFEEFRAIIDTTFLEDAGEWTLKLIKQQKNILGKKVWISSSLLNKLHSFSAELFEIWEREFLCNPNMALWYNFNILAYSIISL
jgi:hypothetical protein